MKDMEQFLKLSREHTDVSAVASRWARYQQREADLATGQEMLDGAGEDADMVEMAQDEVNSAMAEMGQLEGELQRMLLPKDPDDARPAFVEIRAGTGGDESALFAADLARMYTRYCDAKGLRTEIMSASESELGGYKEVVLRIEGSTSTQSGSCGAYGMLKFESGGHRVQRVPATETQGRIHTSACTIAVLAEQDEAERERNARFKLALAGLEVALPVGIITGLLVCLRPRLRHRRPRERAQSGVSPPGRRVR